MFQIQGTLINVFRSPAGKNKEGVAYGGESRLQVQGSNTLRNGEDRIELQTLRTDHPAKYQDLLGKEVTLPVGYFVNNGKVVWYLVEVGEDRHAR